MAMIELMVPRCSGSGIGYTQSQLLRSSRRVLMGYRALTATKTVPSPCTLRSAWASAPSGYGDRVPEQRPFTERVYLRQRLHRSDAADLVDVFLSAKTTTKVLGLASLLLAFEILFWGVGMLSRGMLAGPIGETGRSSADPGYPRLNLGQGLAIASPIPAGQEEFKTKTPRELYERLLREYEEAHRAYIRAKTASKTDEEFEEAQKNNPNEEFARRLLLLAQSQPHDPVAVDAINWTFTIAGIDAGPYAKKAVDLLIKDHLPRGKFGPTCRDLAFTTGRNAERLSAPRWRRARIARSGAGRTSGWPSAS